MKSKKSHKFPKETYRDHPYDVNYTIDRPGDPYLHHTIVSQRGVPLVNVKPPPLYYRIPERLRTPSGMPPGSFQLLRDRAFEAVERDWWGRIQDVVDEKLARSFPTEKLKVERVYSQPTDNFPAMPGYLGVRGTGFPHRWSRAQEQAWIDFEREIGRRVIRAESDFHQQMENEIERARLRAAGNILRSSSKRSASAAAKSKSSSARKRSRPASRKAAKSTKGRRTR